MAIFAASTQTTTSVGNSATQVFNSNASFVASGASVTNVTVVNAGSVDCFLGQSGVTSSTGLRLPAGAQVTFHNWSYPKNTAAANIYAITASGTTTVLSGLATVDATA